MDGTASQEKPVCGGPRWVALLLLRAALLTAATLTGLFIGAHSATASDGNGLRTTAAAAPVEHEQGERQEDTAATSPPKDNEVPATDRRTARDGDASGSVETRAAEEPAAGESMRSSAESGSPATESDEPTTAATAPQPTEKARRPEADATRTVSRASTTLRTAVEAVDRVSTHKVTESTRTATEVSATAERAVARTTTEVDSVTRSATGTLTSTTGTLTKTVGSVTQPVTQVVDAALTMTEPVLGEAEGSIEDVSRLAGLSDDSSVDRVTTRPRAVTREAASPVAPSSPAAAATRPATLEDPQGSGGQLVAAMTVSPASPNESNDEMWLDGHRLSRGCAISRRLISLG